VQFVIGVPPSLKLTLPAGAAPCTVAVNVTATFAFAGFALLVSTVVVAGSVGASTPNASISTSRECPASAALTFTRWRRS
jgi:hypothetical protein